MSNEPTTLRGVLLWICADPWSALARRWNYKSALLSALSRGAMFFTVNLAAGLDAALAALLVECVFRVSTAGFYGALTQAFRNVRPERVGTVATMLLLPAVCHSLELLVHWSSGTERLAASIAASAAFTAVSTAFHLFAMRQGVFVVGEEGRPLQEDLKRVPRLMVGFVRGGARGVAATAMRVVDGQW